MTEPPAPYFCDACGSPLERQKGEVNPRPARIASASAAVRPR